MLGDVNKYSKFIYSLTQSYLDIQGLEARIYTISPTLGKVYGLITFKNEITLKFVEDINFEIAEIYFYSYEIRQSDHLLLRPSTPLQ